MKRSHFNLHDLGSQLQNLPINSAYPGRILIVDEEGEKYVNALSSILDKCRFTVEACPKAAKRHFIYSPTDLVILNHTKHVSCLELLKDFKSYRPSIPIVVTTDCGSEELAVQTFRHGALDYFRKPFPIGDLVFTVRAALEFQRTRMSQESPRPVRRIQRALLYIEENSHVHLKLEQVAREAGMSISCFERHLKKQTGMSFTAYANSLRIAKAKELLGAGQISMLQVALACGFTNQTHFNRTFKKITGLTPGGYQKINPSRDR